ncbi:MAG: hypothetical protein A2W25_14205 [candidate division Zixibacteria bacterium RBG_16_53_22]|nr:MAG: hypothetical protein A2W25_14205 [candidate division Zixibacteria bacterium RBG_16_53_22]
MEFLIDTASGLLLLLFKVFTIVVPLMIVLEVSREFKVLDRLTSAVYPLARRLGFKSESIYPLLAGIIFGISYGGGVLISESNSGRIGRNQMFLIALFLGMCHAVFEDTLLFVSQGANGLVIIVARVTLAIAVVWTASHLIREKGN